jgi:hypothetical protein
MDVRLTIGQRSVRRFGIAWAAAWLSALALPVFAGAASHLTATAVRIGDHPAYVRVVVDFTGGRLINNEVQAGGLTKTGASVRVSHPNVATQAAPRTADGVSVHVLKGSGQLRIQIGFAARRIKYLSYAVVTGDRLAIDLWKSAPPSKAAEVRKGAHGCLVLDSWQVRPGVISVTGSERNIFENTFQGVVRGADGSVLGQHTGVHGPGKWSTQVHYRASRR